MKKIISVVLALFVIFSFCSCNNTPNEEKTKNATNPTKISAHENIENIHIFNVNNANGYVIDSGKTEYSIVISEDKSPIILRASTEFATFIEQATGVKLNVISDNNLEYNNNSKYISLGNTSIALKSKHGFDTSVMNTSSFIIDTEDSSIFILGDDFGVLYGVYELLHQMIGFKVYASDTIVFNKNVSKIELKNYNILDVPDIEYNMSTYGSEYTNSLKAHRMKFYVDKELWMPETGCHSVFRLLDPKVYFEENPEWYSGDRQQLCYTAHGDTEKYEKMVDTLVEDLKVRIDDNPTINNISITQNDVSSWCTCEKCSALKAKYGTDAASQIHFINDVAEKLEKWLNEERDSRKVNLAIFAYQRSEQAPTKVVNGKYEPIDQSVVLRDNVYVWYAPINSDYTSSVYSVENIVAFDTMKAWRAITKSLYLWYYDVNFHYYMIPFNSFDSKQDWYKYSKENDAKMCFYQGKYDSIQYTGFSNFNVYLSSVLGWNVNTDYNETLDDFFTNYFGEASVWMKKLFDEMTTNLSFYKSDLASIFAEAKKANFWPKGLLQQWLGYIDEAYKVLEPLKSTDPEKFELFTKHVNIESLSVRYLLIELYSSRLPYSELDEVIEAFKFDVNKLAVNRLSEVGSMQDYLAKL